MSSKNEHNLCHERISTARSHLGFSQAEMAAQVGLPLRSYQNYERGERETPVVLVRALYQLFRISPIWLLTGQGTMLAPLEQSPRPDTALLQQVIEAVEKFSSDLPQQLSIDHKSRLIALLYEKSLLLSEVAGEKLSPTKLESILKLVA